MIFVKFKVERVEKKQFNKEINLKMIGKFSPIYDSGSSLGREFDDGKVKQMLTDNLMIEAYIRKGVSEIHWEGNKLNHIDLIEKIKLLYPDIVRDIISKVEKNIQKRK